MNNKEIMLVDYSKDKMVRKVERGVNKKLCLWYVSENRGCKRRDLQKWLQRVRGKDVLIKNGLLDSNWGSYVMKMGWFEVDRNGRCWISDCEMEIVLREESMREFIEVDLEGEEDYKELIKKFPWCWDEVNGMVDKGLI